MTFGIWNEDKKYLTPGCQEAQGPKGLRAKKMEGESRNVTGELGRGSWGRCGSAAQRNILFLLL